MKPQNDSSPPPRKSRRRRRQFMFALLLAGIICVFGYDRVKERPEFALLRDAIREVKEQKIVENFTSWRELQVKGNRGNILEVATATADEEFSRQSDLKFLGVSLVSSVANISVPATYRFHIDLTEDWEIEAIDDRLIVKAPSPRPSLPVAYDTAGIERKERGVGRYFTVGDLDDLERTISDRLAMRACDPKTLDSVKEKSRLSIAKFLRSWLLNEKEWAEGKFEELVVLFEGESSDTAVPVLKVTPSEEGAKTPRFPLLSSLSHVN